MPFECSSTRRTASSPALGGLIHRLSMHGPASSGGRKHPFPAPVQPARAPQCGLMWRLTPPPSPVAACPLCPLKQSLENVAAPPSGPHSLVLGGSESDS